jgi:hypothetical protein
MLDSGCWILDAGFLHLPESSIQYPDTFCYLWVNKKTNEPYIGFVDGKFIDHPDLIVDKRSRMKILMLNASKDIPVKKIGGIVKRLIKLRKARKK